MKSERESNIELLRIFSMLMIVCYHIYAHSVYPQLTDVNLIRESESGLFSLPVFSKKMLILATFAPLGKIGDVIFFMISGYFLVAKGNNIDLAKTTKKLLSQQLFAALVLTVSSTVLWKIFSDTYIYLIDFSIFNSMCWFIGFYLVLIIIAKLVLNKYLNKFDLKQYTTFLLVIFALSQFSWPVSFMKDISDGFEVLLVGIFSFALGGAIKRFNLFSKIKIPVLIITIILAFSLVYLSTYNTINLKIENFWNNPVGGIFIQTIPQFEDNNILCIIVGITIFEIFRRIRIKSNRVINFIGSSTLMIYILHDNLLVRNIWKTQNWITLLYERPFMYVAKHIGWTFMTFAIGLLFYVIFCGVSKITNRLYRGMSQK